MDQRETVVGAGPAITYLVVGPSGNDPGRFDRRELHANEHAIVESVNAITNSLCAVSKTHGHEVQVG